MPSFPSFKSPVTTEGVDPAEPEISPVEAREKPGMSLGPVSSVDEENLKAPVPQLDLAAEGAKRSELMQEVWGKHGKLLIFVGCVFAGIMT